MKTPPTNTPGNPGPSFPFWELTPEEQDEFEDICEFTAERAAILEYDVGLSREQADSEALAMRRFPPSDAARARILERAKVLAAHCGLPAWNAAARLDDERIRRLRMVLNVIRHCWTIQRQPAHPQAQGLAQRRLSV